MYKTIVIIGKGLELNIIVIIIIAQLCLWSWWFIRINVLLGCQYVFCDQKQFHCKNAFLLSEIYTGELPEPKPMVTEDSSVFNSNYCDNVTTDNEVPPVPPKLFDLSVPPQTLDPSAPPVPPKLVDFSI